MCIYIHKKIGRGLVVAAHSHREGRSPPGRWSWKVKDRNNQFLEVIIFSLSLSPRIVTYTEDIDSAEERRGGATQRSLNPGKEGPRAEERPLRLVTWPVRGAASAARLCGENGALFKGNNRTPCSRARGSQSCYTACHRGHATPSTLKQQMIHKLTYHYMIQYMTRIM